MTIAARWQQREGTSVRCGLCFRNCSIAPGGAGFCGVRRHTEGHDGPRLVSPWLGIFASQAVDPIEKKPLYHWRPGSKIYSLGSVGCTMGCPFCQNHELAHPNPGLVLQLLHKGLKIPPQALAPRVKDLGLSSVAFTYNEPTLQAEYILEAAPTLRQSGVALVLVTNGMMSASPAEALVPWVDAANIDLKTFNPRVYARLGGSLEVVKTNVAAWLQAGVHVELTCLVVPGVSDSAEELDAMAAWIASLSPEVPLHLSRYFPAFRYDAPPTDKALLSLLAERARKYLKNVHLGNV